MLALGYHITLAHTNVLHVCICISVCAYDCVINVCFRGPKLMIVHGEPK